MKYLEFYEKINEQLKEQFSEESKNIEEAARLCSKSIMKNRLIHLFGCGHSQMFVMEAFYRAGGLVQVNPLLIPHLALYPKAKLSTLQERLEGFSTEYLDLENTSSDDTMIIISISGRNAAVVDMALKAKELGMSVIALTSKKFSGSVESRHSSGKLLKDVADVVIDIKCVAGDAVLSIDEIEPNFCGTSTVLGMSVIESIIAQTIEECVKNDYIPPIFVSSNLDTGDNINKEYLNRYRKMIRFY